MSDSRYQKLNESDEIDLVELVKNLWKKKLWIILSAFVCTAISAGYAFTAKEQWTSKSVVIAPKVANLGDYLSFRSEYASILDIKDFSTYIFLLNKPSSEVNSKLKSCQIS